MPLVQSHSGVRGTAEELMPVIPAYALSYGQWLRKRSLAPTVIIGHDPRPSCEQITQSLIGHLGRDVRVVDIGVVTTPMLEHTVREEAAHGGVMLTASHNPLHHNGFKFLREDGALLAPDDMAGVIGRAHELMGEGVDGVGAGVDGMGAVRVARVRSNPGSSYLDFVLSLLPGGTLDDVRSFYADKRVILDPNGGAACGLCDVLRLGMGIPLEVIHGSVARGPQRGIEPNGRTLAAIVSTLGPKDLYVGFDFDADRAELGIPVGSKFASEFGQVVSGQYVLGLMTEYVLGRKGAATGPNENVLDAQLVNVPGIGIRNRTIVVNDGTSWLVKDVARRHGGRYVEVGTGEINVVDTMIDQHAALSGDGSSSGFIHPATRCRDGVMTWLYTLALTAERGQDVGGLLDSMPRYYTLRDDDQRCEPNQEAVARVMGALQDYYSGRGYELSRPDRFSGLKVIMDEGWVWFRASATTAGQFRIYSDARSKPAAEQLLEDGRAAYKQAVDATRD